VTAPLVLYLQNQQEVDVSDGTVQIGVIGGSGLYNMSQLTDVEERIIETPFGRPSDSLVIGTLSGMRIAFLPRHGRGHIFTPSEVPYRANIYAMKTLGVRWLVAISACGSLREDFAPGDIVIPDQLFDNTRNERDRSFFGNGLVAHISVADPFCEDLSSLLAASIREAGGQVHLGGSFVTIEGPRFSTRAESNFYRSVGLSIIGMTTSPEAFLAREAEMCYAVMAHVTDYDVWHETKTPVSVEMVIETINANIELARQSLVLLTGYLKHHTPTCSHDQALADALMTDRRKIPRETLEHLRPIVGKYLD